MKDYREKARKYIEKDQLVSVMNDTKWTEFRNAMINEMPFSPPYIIKNIYELEEGLYFTHFNEDVNYLGAYEYENGVYTIFGYKRTKISHLSSCY